MAVLSLSIEKEHLAEQRLDLKPRTLLGKKVGRLRRQGILPAVIFGHGDSIPVQVESRSFELGYRRWGRTTLLMLTGVDGDIPALVHDVTRNPRTGALQHVDFFRVSLTEKTHAEVPLHFIGESNAVKNLNGVLYHQKTSVTVEALPQDMPHRIDVDLSSLETMEHLITVRNLVVDTSIMKILDDADELVVKVVQQRAEEVIAPPPVAEAAVVPEGEVVEGAEAAQPGTAAGTAPTAGARAAPASPDAKTAARAQAQQPAKK